MRFGFGVLRLGPEAFWAMTPRELALAFEAFSPRTGSAPGRAALDRLMGAFPDKEKTRG